MKNATTGKLLGWVAVLLGWALGASSALAQTIVWTNPTLGNWFIPANWNPIIPQAGSIAEINNGGDALVDAPGAVADFLYLGFLSNNSGSAVVRGSGTLTLGAILEVNSGSIDINSGGRVVVLENPNIGATTQIGSHPTTGTILVAGTGSYLSSGSTRITESLGSGTTTSTGILQIESGGRVDSTYVYMGNTTLGSATATVTGTNSLWSISHDLNVGAGGAASSVTISNHGTVNVLDTKIGGNGNVTVTGAGSSFHNSAGTTYIGLFGAGGLNVQSGGLATSVNVDLGSGFEQAPGVGTATITGAGSTWNNSANLTIGGSSSENESATGAMIVSSGGRVTTASAQIGLLAGSVGTATVSGGGSTWAASSDIVVGQSGSGSLEISGGGAVSNLRTHIGFNSGSSGSVIVHDPGSILTGTGSFFIGNGGIGSLQVLNGGVASTAGNSYLGFSTTALGNAIVSGAGSTWNTASGLYIGGNAAAPGGAAGSSLSIEDGGVVNAGAITLYNTGTLELVNNSTLSGPLTSQGGLIRTFGDTALANNVSLGAGGVYVVNITAGSTSTFSGSVSGSGGLTKSGLGAGATLRLTGDSNYTGTTTVNSGTLVVDGTITSATTINSGGTLGGAGTVGTLDIKSGGTVAPGSSAGLLTASDAMFRGGGNYKLKLQTDGNGVVGMDWASLAVNGALDISTLSPSSPFNLRLQTLDTSGSPNSLAVWNSSVSHTWSSIVSTTAGFLGGFDSSLFQVDTTGFQNAKNGTFRVVQNGANLDLQYDATLVDSSVVVDNLAEPLRSTTPIANLQYWGAQSFLLDAQHRRLTSVEAIVGNGGNSSDVVAELRRDDSNGNIDQTAEGLLTTFTASDLTGDLTARLFSPDSNLVLDPGAKYWFVLGALSAATYDWAYADTNNYVGPGSLSDYADTSDGGATWDYRDSSHPYFIQVKAVVSVLDGDYNNNGIVDAADYIVWCESLGATGTGLPADGDGNGTVDQSDFDTWRNNFGATFGSGSSQASASSVSVPEPAMFTMSVLIVFFISVRRFKRVAA